MAGLWAPEVSGTSTGTTKPGGSAPRTSLGGWGPLGFVGVAGVPCLQMDLIPSPFVGLWMEQGEALCVCVCVCVCWCVSVLVCEYVCERECVVCVCVCESDACPAEMQSWARVGNQVRDIEQRVAAASDSWGRGVGVAFHLEMHPSLAESNINSSPEQSRACDRMLGCALLIAQVERERYFSTHAACVCLYLSVSTCET